jgi:hypothetical protein
LKSGSTLVSTVYPSRSRMGSVRPSKPLRPARIGRGTDAEVLLDHRRELAELAVEELRGQVVRIRVRGEVSGRNGGELHGCRWAPISQRPVRASSRSTEALSGRVAISQVTT